MDRSDPVIARVQDDIGEITLNRPSAMNAITIELAEELERALLELEPAVRVITIRGAGGNFCAGGDIGQLAALRAEGAAATAPLFEAFESACERIGQLSVPVLSVVAGYAMAGGFELMQASDLAIVANDAVIGDYHLNFGQIPAGGGSQRLPRLVGRQRASAHILAGDRLTGAEAVEWGLAYVAVPATELEAAASQLAQRLADKPPLAMTRAKRLIRDGLELSLRDGLALERRVVLEHMASDEVAAGIARFAAKER